MVDKVLLEIKSTVEKFFGEPEIILFGSRARGDNDLDSDYDLLIIVNLPQTNAERLHYQAAIRNSLAKQHILADVIIHSGSDIEAKKKLPGHLVHVALLEGVRV